MADDDRAKDAGHSSSDDRDPSALPYGRAVLAAKLAAAREQRQKVLAARAAAEGDPTRARPRAMPPAFVRDRHGTPTQPFDTGVCGAETGTDAAPNAPASRGVERSSASLASVANSDPTEWEPRSGDAAALAYEPPSGAHRGGAEARKLVADADVRRRRPVAATAPVSPAHSLPAASMPPPLSVAGWMSIGGLMGGLAAIALVVSAPADVRRQLADAIAPKPASIGALTSSARMPEPAADRERDSDTNSAIAVELDPARRASSSAPSTLRSVSEGVEVTAVPPVPDAGDVVAPRPPPADHVPAATAASSSSAKAGPPPPSARVDDVTEPPTETGPVPGIDESNAQAGGGETRPPEPLIGLGRPAAASRVVLHFPASAASVASRVEAALRSAGVGDVTTVPASFAVSRTNVRYYRPAYRGLADDVAALTASRLDGAPVETRDFTDFQPPPAAGTIEVWLAGSNEAPPPGGRSTESGTSTTLDPAPAIPVEHVGARAAAARVAERERLADEVTRMLQTQLQQRGEDRPSP